MKTLPLILTLVMHSLVYAQSADAQSADAPSALPSEHRAWIDVQSKSDMLTIQGKFANDGHQDVAFRYELTTTKQGKSGSSSSTQAGSFVAPAQQEVSLSHVSINLNKGDTCLIELKIVKEDTVYLHHKIEYQG